MSTDWTDSGKGPIQGFNLQTAHQLAINAGYVFNNTEGQPPAKRAHLQAMFDHFEVNSLSAFKQLFFIQALDRRTSPKSCSTSTPRLTWVTQRNAVTGEVYTGEQLYSKRQGTGMLLIKGCKGPMIYLGLFSEGLQNGYGVIITSRGEAIWGYFKDGIPWGPAEYRYPPPASPIQQQQPFRLTYRGMFNGKPMGKGTLEWSDGRREVGRFNGSELEEGLSQADCDGIAAAVDRCRGQAEKAAREMKEVLMKRGLWDPPAWLEECWGDKCFGETR